MLSLCHVIMSLCRVIMSLCRVIMSLCRVITSLCRVIMSLCRNSCRNLPWYVVIHVVTCRKWSLKTRHCFRGKRRHSQSKWRPNLLKVREKVRDCLAKQSKFYKVQWTIWTDCQKNPSIYRVHLYPPGHHQLLCVQRIAHQMNFGKFYHSSFTLQIQSLLIYNS